MEDDANDNALNGDGYSDNDEIESGRFSIIDEHDFNVLLKGKQSLKISYEGIGADSRLSALLPAAMNIGNAIDEYQHAIVKLPKGIHIGDLANRRTSGWEGWKALFHQGKNGKITRQVAIKQVGLSPAIVATLGFQIAALAVGQQYIADIDKKIESLNEGIEAIQEYLEAEQVGRIKGAFRSLQSYVKDYSEYVDDTEKRIAAKTTLEGLRHDANVLWAKNMELLEGGIQDLNLDKHMDEKGIRKSLNELRKLDDTLLTIYQLISTIEKVRMQYDEDFSSKRIERVRNDSKELADEYVSLRNDAQDAIRNRIDVLRNFPLAIPGELEDDNYEDHHIVADTVHDVGRFFERMFHETPIDAAKQQLKKTKDELHGINDQESNFNHVSREGLESLDRLNFLLNEASAVIEEEDGIYFVGE